MHYVYIIRSIRFTDQIYVGCTEDIKKRLSSHNSGITPYTDKFKPWKMETIFYHSKLEHIAFSANYDWPARTSQLRSSAVVAVLLNDKFKKIKRDLRKYDL